MIRGAHRGHRAWLKAVVALMLMVACGCGGGDDTTTSDEASETGNAESSTDGATLESSYEPEPIDDPASLGPTSFIELGDGDAIDYVDTMASSADGAWVSILGDRDDDAPNRAVLLDPTSGDVKLDVELEGRPGSVAATNGAAWVWGFDEGLLERVDAGSGDVSSQRADCGVAAGDDIVWAFGSDDGSARLDPETGTPTGDSVVLTADAIANRVGRFEVEFTEPAADIPLDCATAAVSAGALWLVLPDAIAEVDPLTGAVRHLLGVGSIGDVSDIEAVPDGVWLIVDAEDEDGEDVEELWYVASGGAEDIGLRIPLDTFESRPSELAYDGQHLLLLGTDDPGDGPPVSTLTIADATTAAVIHTLSIDVQHNLGLTTSAGRVLITAERPYGVQLYE